ncbi:integrin alpha-PS3-like, partial [Rhagoletis pomonella]|uniref:integrin alpha-PS3-like n=1 Tax=Rhagoletis pomonella TaxID=28610 RepID=UPI00177B162A
NASFSFLFFFSIIVGAPRAQSTLPAQRNINETGAIYHCTLSATSTCNPYVIDDRGNITIENFDSYTYDNEARDNQWLGAAMDGGTKDTDKLLICAPRFLTPTANDYLMNGICYWVKDTLNDNPTKVQRISPLRLKSEQRKTVNNHPTFYYMLAEEGLSAHVTDNNEEFVIGAPGISNWKGSAIHVRKRFEEDPILSRRDTSERKRVTRQIEFSGQYVLNTEDQASDSYFGYAVGSGYFDSKDKDRLMYVATAPQANLQSGEAYLYKYSEDSTLKLTRVYVFRGTHFGEYFGYSLLTEDLNGDGLTDVVISAPQYSTSGSFDDGAIYVFLNKGNFNFEQKLIVSPAHGNARFGTTLSRLGDINHDGFNDIAVGAPFAGNGAVFIYLGSNDGIRQHYSQRLNSPDAVVSKYGEHMFGHGLSKGADIDNNGFNDFAVGAPNAEAVFVYRAYPVVKIHATVKSQTREIKTDQNSFKITTCYRITTPSAKVNDQDLAIRIVVDPQVKRAKLVQTRTNEISFNATAGLQEQCRSFDCEVHSSVADIFKPIELEMHYDLINGVPNSGVFCDKCAAVDPAEPKVYSEKIIFSTGCSSDICVADLEVKSHNLDHTYILGSSRTLFSIPKTPHVNLEKISNTTEIINNYEIKSVGPSTVGAMDVIFYIPVAYKVPGTTNTIQIIEMDKINMQAVYDAQLIGIDYYQNNTQLIMNTIEVSTSTHSTTTVSKTNKHKHINAQYDSHSFYEMTVESESSTHTDDTTTLSVRRRRRRDAAANTATRAQYARIVKAHELLSEDLRGKLPVNRTIVFNCNDPEMTICVRSVMRVYNFKPEKPITVTMKYQVDLNEINQILIEPWEYFVILIGVDVKKIGDSNGKSLAIRRSIDYNIVSKHQLYGTPIWVYILAVMGGLLLLALMTYGMYKLGFFKRAKKEEMDALVHQGSTRPARDDVEPEAENLNTDRN